VFNEMYSKVCIGKHLNDNFLCQIVWDKKMIYRQFLSASL
jgi:hypothetical protein